MNLKRIIVVLMVLFLISIAVADARSGGRGSRSSSSASKSISSTASGSLTDGVAKLAGLTTASAATKSIKKKIHLDDDILENDTANETDDDSQPLPGAGAFSTLLAIGLMGAWKRHRS